jgi:hypothetical protein
VRDPSGVLRRQLEANGAFADGTIGFADEQQLLYSVLRAQGSPVSLNVLPDSVHDRLSDAGWKVCPAAFPKATARTDARLRTGAVRPPRGMGRAPGVLGSSASRRPAALRPS